MNHLLPYFKVYTSYTSPMPTHYLTPSRQTTHGHFSPDLPPVLTIAPGDTVVFETVDAGWGNWWEGEGDEREDVRRVEKQDKQLDAGPALCGPVFIEGVAPGDLLRISIDRIELKDWGFCASGGWRSETNDFLKVASPQQHRFTKWKLDSRQLTGTDEQGVQIKLRPFMGTMGMPMAAPAVQNAIHSTPAVTSTARNWCGAARYTCRWPVLGRRRARGARQRRDFRPRAGEPNESRAVNV